MNTIDLIQKFEEFVRSDKDIEYRARTCDKHLIIDFLDMLKFESELGNHLLETPIDTLKGFELVVKKFREDSREIKVRFINVDKIPSCNIRIRDVRIDDYTKFKIVTGVIKSISEIYGEIISRKFECPACGNILNVLQERFQPKREPSRCGCGRKGKFTEISNEKIDSQKMVVEEDLETIEGNQQPNRIDIILQYGLCSSEIEKYNTLGSRVAVSGILLSKPKLVKGSTSNELEKYMEANYIKSLEDKYKEIQITKEDEKKIIELSKRDDLLDIFVSSYAPYIAGYKEVKTAICLQIFSGVNKTGEKGRYERGDFHILLIGDPATGKTQLAKASEKRALKYRYTSGVRSSRAGMTVMVTKDEFIGTWGIEAGAVVLANKGICVCDEFDKMTEDDRDALHEAMEEQTITVDKAGIHTRLNAKTSILACANWKGSRFDPNRDIYSQIDMPDSLISRFDLYFVFIDRPDEEKDKEIISHMLGEFKANKVEVEDEFWRKYIIYAKSFNPKLSFEMKQKIKELYVDIRKQSKIKKEENDMQVITITARQGDAFRRLSEASARLHLRDVTEADIVNAKDLIMYSLKSVAFDLESGKIDIDMIETGISSRQQHIIHQIRNEVERLAKLFSNLIPIGEVAKLFPDREIEFEEVMTKLIRSGEYYEPRRGYIAKL